MTSYVVLGFGLHFSKPQCFHLWNGKYCFIAPRGVVRKKMSWYVWKWFVNGKGFNRNKVFLPLFCAWVRKLAFGKSQDGRGGVLLGTWIWALTVQAIWIPRQGRVRGCQDVSPRKTNGMSSLERIQKWRRMVRKWESAVLIKATDLKEYNWSGLRLGHL